MKRLKKSANKGFTLAEMLIVVAILAILTAVAAPNVAKYVKSIKLRELDDSARSIYMAAQHELKSDIETGRDIAKDNKLDVPDRYTYGGTTGVEKINYLVYYGTVPSGGIISTSAIEPELAANNYVIEFNAETGDVYGVFYSVDPSEFVNYEKEYNEPDGKYAAAVNKTGDRVSTLGYYGLENVSVSAPPKPEEIPVPEVRVINAEKLVLRITAPNFSNKENKAYIAIDICDADDNDKIVHLVPHDGSHYMSSSGTADIILDSLEPNGHAISNELAGIAYEEKFSSWADGIITPGEDLNIKVTFYDPKGVAIDQTKTVRANSLFANGSSPETANIEYGRHLQNLGECDTIQTVDIIKTIDFKAPGDKEKIKNTTAEQDGYKHWSIVYKTTGDNFGGYTEKLFHAVTTYATKISAKPGVQIRYLNAEGGGIFAELDGAEVSGLVIVNATVEGDKSGAIAASASGGSFTNCRAYVEALNGEVWNNPEAKDPFEAYTVTGESTAGGLVGEAENVNFTNCYASVKVCGKTVVGGLIGKADGENLTVTDCFVGGHTEGGQFTENRRDNVSGATAGGLIGKASSTVKLTGTVFTTCSVKGEAAANPICPDTDKIKILGVADDYIYTLGKAFLGDAEADFTLPANAKDASEATADTPGFGKRYDNSVGSTFKHRVPDGMTMHGDWTTAETVSGFFYWEIEDRAWRIHALTVSGEPQYFKNICSERDGKNIEKYGYGAFSSGALSDVAFKKSDGSAIEIAPEESDSADIEGIKSALNALGVAAENVNLYNIDEPGFMTATVGGSEYKFAPDFYAIYAEKSGKRAGTEDGVYGIRCKAHLENVGKYSGENSAAFVQSHDIAPGEIKPIGDAENPFKGSYDGGSYRIISARILAADGSSAGLFGATEGANLKNIVLVHPTATAAGFISLAVKEEPETISAPGSAALSALNGVRVNESLAAVSGGMPAGLTLPYTKTISYSGGMILLDGNEIEAIINQLGDSNVDLIFDFQIPNVIWYVNATLSPDGMYTSNKTSVTFSKIDNLNGAFKVSYAFIKENALTSDGKYKNLYIAADLSGDISVSIKVDGEIAPPCDHEYGDWTSYDNQHHRRTCKNCGTAYEEANHSNNGTYNTDDTSHWFECEVCGAEYDKTAHTLEGTATSYDEEKHTGNCAVCKRPFAQNHTLSGWTDSEDKVNHVKKCSGCDYELSEAHDFAGGSAEKCAVCGAHNPAFKSYAPTTPACVGGIVGKATGGSIENCVVAGYILQGSSAVGGIAGESTADISRCEANVKFAKCGESAKVGGIAGNGSKISASYALVHGIETPAETLGGIAGSTTVKVENCYVIFAGQTAGYPVAETAEHDTCYFVNDEGYCSVSESSMANIATGVTLEELKSKKISDDFSPAGATYINKVEEADGAYQYPAIFTADGQKEHYGPVPEATKSISGEVVTGPLVGLYNLRQTNQGDVTFAIGYLSYNRNGKLYSNEFYNGDLPFDITNTEILRGRYIGLFLEKDASQDGLRYYVTNNGKIISAILVPFEDIYGVDMHYSSQNVMFYTSQGKLTELDLHRWEDENNWHNSDVNKRFDYYVLCDTVNKRPLPIYSDTSIDVEYTDPKTGKTGNILHAQGPLFKTEFIKTELDDMPIPEVTIFRSAPFIDYNNGSMVCTDKQVYDDTFVSEKTNSTQFGNLWVMLPAEYKDDIENGNIRFLYCNELMTFGEGEIRYWQSENDGSFGDLVNNNQFVPITIPDDKIIVHLASGKAKEAGGEGADKNAHNWFKIDVLFGTRTIASKGIDKWSGQEITSIKELKTQDEYTPMVGIFNRKLKSSGDGAFQMVFNENGVVYSNADDAYVKNYNEIVTKVYGVFMLMGDQPYVSGVSVFVDGKAQEISLEDYTKSISETWRQYDFKGNDGSATQKKFEKTYTLYQLDDPKISPDSDIKVYIGDELMLELTGADIGA